METGQAPNGSASGEHHDALIATAIRQVAEAAGRQAALGGVLAPDDSRAAGLLAPDSIPGYQVLREIHRGGQGIVYQAIQSSTGRKVALKVMKEGPFAGSGDRARFEREVHVLAQLDHPHIVAIHDSGSAAGCHYFVMNYIRGQPLDVYMAGARDRHKGTEARRHEGNRGPGVGLSVGGTLRLFEKICEAINAAHLRGVIHRDIKPSNIRIGENGAPHILDFGLAKVAISGQWSVPSGQKDAADPSNNQSLIPNHYTQTGQFVGSLPWASPEQAQGAASKVDMRTDVYSLGVVLYQMLTGKFPYEVADNMREVLNRIVNDAPVRPRLLRRDIDDEVETMVLKCLQKDRERRYQTAGELTRDIRHYLAGEPIEAKRDSFGYVVRKQFRRHRVGFAVAAGFLLLLTGGLAFSLHHWFRAEKALVEKDEQRKKTDSQRQRAESIGTFLKEVLTLADPAKAKGEKLTVREALDKAAKRIEDGALREQPLVEAEIRFTIGSTYYALSLYPQAEAQLRAADALQSRNLGDEHPDTLRTRCKLAETLSYRTDYAAAAMLAQPTMEAQRRVLGPDHPETLQSMVVLGSLLWEQVGRFAEAESLLRSAIERRGRVLGQNDPATADAMDRLGLAYICNTYPAKAEPLHREALRIHTQSLGAEHPATLLSMTLLAGSLYNQGRPEEAEAILRRALEPSLRVLGPEHIETLSVQGNLANALAAQGRNTEAETIYRESLAALLRTGRPTDRSTITAQRFLAACLVAQRKYPEAETLLRQALDAAREKYGPEHGDTSIPLMCALANVLVQQRKDAEAEQVARQVLEFQHRQLPRPNPGELTQSSSALIEVLQRRGASDEALRFEQELIEYSLAAAREPDASAGTLIVAARKLLNPANEKLRDAPQALELALQANERSGHQKPGLLNTLAQAYVLTGDSARATQVWEQEFALSHNDQWRAVMLNGAAWQLLFVKPETLRNPAGALEFALRANELSGYKNSSYVNTLTKAYLLTGDSARATQVWQQAIALSADDQSRAVMLNGAAWNLLTVMPETLRDPAEALQFALRANELSGCKNPSYVDTLALAYFRTGDVLKAIEFQKQALGLLPQDAPDRPEYASRMAEFEAALEKASGKDAMP